MDEDFDSSTASAWRRFQARLADHLLAMQDDDLLLLEAETALEDEDGAAPYVQFCAWGSGQLRCEAVSNHYLAEEFLLDDAGAAALVALGFEPPSDDGSANFWSDVVGSDGDRLAVMAVRALRDVYGVAHPSFVLGLPVEGDGVPTEGELGGEPATSDEAPAVFPVDGPEHLEFLVDVVLESVLGHEPVHDDDGDVPLDCGDVVGYVRVRKDKPVIQLFACVAADVADRDRARFEVEVLNRDTLFFRFALHGDAVVMETDIVAWPFAPAHLRELLKLMRRTADQVHGDLAARLGSAPGSDPGCEVLHPALQTLLELDDDDPDSVAPELAATICDHDRELILRLLGWLHDQETSSRQHQRLTRLLRGALRVTVERKARSGDRSRHGTRRPRQATRRRVPDPTLEEVDPEMWG